MQLFSSSEQVHGRYQSDQPEKMIAMQMADEDVVDPLHFYLAAPELKLRSFGAIDQKQAFIMVDQLRCGISLERWNSRITAEYGYVEYHKISFEGVK